MNLSLKKYYNCKKDCSFYRLSRCRHIKENLFVTLVPRFQVFRRPIITSEEVVNSVTKASIVLHNYLMGNKEFET